MGTNFVEWDASSVAPHLDQMSLAPQLPFSVSGENLSLDIPAPEDISEITAACQDPEIQRFTSVPVPFGLEHGTHFVEKVTADIWNHGGASWVIRVQHDGKACLAGILSFRAALNRNTDVGYWVAPEWRGRGLMQEALRLGVQTVFDRLDCGCVVWTAQPGNLASIRAAWHVGFTFAGMVRGLGEQHGLRHDMLIGTLLPGDTLTERTPWEVVTQFLPVTQ